MSVSLRVESSPSEMMVTWCQTHQKTSIFKETTFNYHYPLAMEVWIN